MENILTPHIKPATPGKSTTACQNDFVFEQVYKRYWNPLVNFSSTYLGDKGTSEELVQELFIQLHVRKASLNIKTSISSYLYAAMRNRIFNHFRARAIYRKHIQKAAEDVADRHNNVEQSINLKELQGAISGYLETIPVKYRQVFELSDHDQLPVKKIAQVLNRPLNTVEKQLRRTNKLLRVHLQQKNGTTASSSEKPISRISKKC